MMVGGVTAAGRLNPVLGRPYYFDHGDGCRLWDVDGREFIDFSSSNGASMLGFNHPRSMRQLRRVSRRESLHSGDRAPRCPS